MSSEAFRERFKKVATGEETFVQARAREQAQASTQGKPTPAKPKAAPAPVPPPPAGWTPTSEQGPTAPVSAPPVPGGGSLPSSGEPVTPNPNLVLPDADDRLRAAARAQDPAALVGDWLTRHIRRKWQDAAPTREAMLDALSGSGSTPTVRR